MANSVNKNVVALDASRPGTTSQGWSEAELIGQLETALSIAQEDAASSAPSTESSIGLRLVYQPIITIHDKTIAGFEALTRWTHESFGVIPPSVFVPLAERTGLIQQLTRWVLERSTAVASTWPGAVKLAVNVSPNELHSKEFERKLLRALTRSGLPPARIELEITEGAALPAHGHVVGLLNGLRALGVRIILDDFGTGYASLHALCALPVDGIKIDRVFIAEMLTSPAYKLAVEATLALAEGLGVDVVAEGIETPSQLLELRRLGCKYGQGFFTGKPLDQRLLGSVLR